MIFADIWSIIEEKPMKTSQPACIDLMRIKRNSCSVPSLSSDIGDDIVVERSKRFSSVHLHFTVDMQREKIRRHVHHLIGC